jgi:hypothetical protein
LSGQDQVHNIRERDDDSIVGIRTMNIVLLPVFSVILSAIILQIPIRFHLMAERTSAPMKMMTLAHAAKRLQKTLDLLESDSPSSTIRFALATSSARLVTLGNTITTHEFPDLGASPGIRPEVIHSQGESL